MATVPSNTHRTYEAVVVNYKVLKVAARLRPYKYVAFVRMHTWPFFSQLHDILFSCWHFQHGFFSEHYSSRALFPHFSGGNFIFAAKAEERAAALPLLGGIGELFHIPVGISFSTWDCKMQFAILMVKLKWLFAEDRESIRFFLFHVVMHHARSHFP